MTEVQVRILEIFKRLEPAEQEDLTASEIVALDEGVAQAEQGETRPVATLTPTPPEPPQPKPLTDEFLQRMRERARARAPASAEIPSR